MAAPLSNGNRRFTQLRQIIILALGVFVILNAALAHAADVIEWTAGLVLIGLVPIEAIFGWWHNGHPTPPTPPPPPAAPGPPSEPSP
jgi:hypothetical protein